MLPSTDVQVSGPPLEELPALLLDAALLLEDAALALLLEDAAFALLLEEAALALPLLEADAPPVPPPLADEDVAPKLPRHRAAQSF